MVRRFLLSTTALAAMSGFAFAADLTTRPPPAPFVPPAFTWTGLYIGGTVGAVSTSTGYGEGYGSYSVLTPQTDTGGGVLAGVTVGYNYQMGNIVLGLEGDWSYAGTQSNYTDSYNYFFGSSKLTSLGTARVRLGYTPWDRTLLYATGGFAWGSLTNALGYDYPSPGYSQKSSSTASGWTIGGGLEQALTDHITVKVEALYVDLGTAHGYDKYCGCRTNFKTTAVVGRVGLNIKF